jgi:hypothetical protein
MNALDAVLRKLFFKENRISRMGSRPTQTIPAEQIFEIA